MTTTVVTAVTIGFRPIFTCYGYVTLGTNSGSFTVFIACVTVVVVIFMNVTVLVELGLQNVTHLVKF